MPIKDSFKNKYRQLLGLEESQALFHAIEDQAQHHAFRLNSEKPAALAALKSFSPEPLKPAPYAESAYLGKISGNSPLARSGYIYNQDPSAMIVASVANCQPDEWVLDLCAAPGGKALQVASAMQGQGLLVANEINSKRAKELSRNIEHWGVGHCIVTSYRPDELASFYPQSFDCILVDAPCSGEGMFRKHQAALDQWTPDYPTECAIRQQHILQSALQMLKPGGRLIYSTCTFAPEENEAIVSWLVQEHQLKIAPIDSEQFLASVSHGRPDWGSVEGLEGCLRLWPHLNPGEGHFVAQLIKPLTPSHSSQIKKNTKASPSNFRCPNKEEKELWQDFSSQCPLEACVQESNGRLFVRQNTLYFVPQGQEKIPLHSVLRWGLEVGQFLKGRFEPSFSLAMAVKDISSTAHLDIDEEQWKDYMAGLTLKASEKDGWYLLCLKGIPVAFGKLVKGTIKNFYPKGLRFQAKD